MKHQHHILPLLLVALMLVACSDDPAPVAKRASAYVPAATAQAEIATLPLTHEAVGTVNAKTDTRVEAQVTGRVLKILVRPGDMVKTGDDLIVLDSRASQTKLERAHQARASAQSMTAQARDFLAAAKAGFSKAESTYKRMNSLFQQKVVTAEEVEKAEANYLQAKARLGQANEGVTTAQARAREAGKVVEEAEIGLGYTTIKALEDGKVAQRLAEPGDLAFPGKGLLTLQTGGALRLEAMVRESLIGKVRLGDKLGIVVAALGDQTPLAGVVEEVEPLADPVTRSFLVKVRLPALPGLYPGMFGRLMVPLGQEQTILVPKTAIRRVGQLETVMIQANEGWQSVHVRTGKLVGEKIVVLSGLSGNETVGIGGSGQ